MVGASGRSVLERKATHAIGSSINYPKFSPAAKKHGQGIKKNEIVWAQNQYFKLYRNGSLYSVADRYETQLIEPSTGLTSAETARQLLQQAIDSMPTKAAKLAAGRKKE